MRNPLYRTIFFFLILILVVILPWWLSTLLLFGLTIYLPFYLEVLFFGFLLDLLYSPSFSFPYIGLTFATVLLLIIMFIKTQIRR